MKKLMILLKSIWIKLKRRTLEIEIIRANIKAVEYEETLYPSIKISVFTDGNPLNVFDFNTTNGVRKPISWNIIDSVNIRFRESTNIFAGNQIIIYDRSSKKKLEECLNEKIKEIKSAFKDYKKYKIAEEIAELSWENSIKNKKFKL